jgi:hypothetical protein
MSTSLNTLSGTIYEDFLSRWLPTDKQTEVVVNFIMKLTVCVVGVVCVLLVFWIEKLGSVIQVGNCVSTLWVQERAELGTREKQATGRARFLTLQLLR